VAKKKTAVTINILADNKQMKGVLKDTDSALAGFGKKAGFAMAAGVGAIGAIGVSSVNAAIDFESSMAQVFTLLPGISGDAMDTMDAQVLDFSKSLGVLPGEVVPALYDALSAGVPQDNVFEFMEIAGKAAIGGNLEVADAVDLLSTAVNAYASTGLEAAEASDIFFTTVRLGKTTVPELQASFSSIGPIAAALGVGLDEVGASIAVLTASGTPTSVAANQMKAALAELGKTGSKASTAFEEIAGVSFNEVLASGGDLEDVMEIIADSGVPVIDMFGSIEAGQGVLGLIANEGEAFSNALTEMGTSAGATEDAFDTMDATSGRSMDRIKANLSAVSIELGDKLLPAFAAVTDWVVANWDQISNIMAGAFEFIVAAGQKLIAVTVNIVEKLVTFGKWVNDNDPVIAAIAVVIGSAFVGAMVSATAAVWAKVAALYAQAVAFIAANATLIVVVAALAVFAAAVVWAYENVHFFVDAINFMKDAAIAAFGWLKDNVPKISGSVFDALKALPGLFVDAGGLLLKAGKALFVKAKDGILEGLAIASAAIWEWLKGVPGDLLDLGVDLFTLGLDLFGRLAEGIKSALSKIPGMLWDLVMSPIYDIIDLGKRALDLNPLDGSFLGFGKDESEKRTNPYDTAAGTPIGFTLHDGGDVTQAMASAQNFGNVRSDEVIAKLQVGETVVTADGRGGSGINIENLNVSSDRSINDELQLMLALKGVAA
jgi:TP901 family phage tail tape measure protein